MSTTAIALSSRAPLLWDRARGLFNGFGYMVVLTLILVGAWEFDAALPQIVAGHAGAAFAIVLSSLREGLIGVIPGPILTPIAVNMAPRAGARRVGWLLFASVPMAWWCLYFQGITFGWDWHTAGYALDGLMTTSLVVIVCAYHSYSQAAADTLMRTRIERTSLEAASQGAHLQLLRAQIEPHFLFNTLSVVRALARADRAATLEMLDNLIRYFEAALPRLRESEVPLAQEMELVDAYLAIYRARMGARLAYEVDLPEQLRQMRVPAMTLLTLVENALKHGVNPTVEGGFIRVSAARERDLLLLRVADSGRGLEVRHGRGAGLANIRQRLLMMYGPGAMLSLKPAEPRGTVASVSIPVS